MSDIDRITHKAALLSAAIATLGADEEWDRRLAEVLRLDALQSACAEYGQLGKALEKHSAGQDIAGERFGPGWQQVPRRLLWFGRRSKRPM